MNKFADIINNLIDNLPAILIATTGIIVAYTKLKAKLDEVGTDAKDAKDLTLQGNTDIAKANTALADHADQLEIVHEAVNSGTARATDAALVAADQNKTIAVHVATLEAEKAAAIKASELATAGREEALKIAAMRASEAADLREQIRLLNARNEKSGPTEVIVANKDPVRVQEVESGDGFPPSGTH